MPDDIKIVVEDGNKEVVEETHTESAIEAAATIVETAQDLAKDLARSDTDNQVVLMTMNDLHTLISNGFSDMNLRLTMIETNVNQILVNDAIDEIEEEIIEEKLDDVIEEIKIDTVEVIEEKPEEIQEEVKPQKRQRKWL